MSGRVTDRQIFLSYAQADDVVPDVDRDLRPGWVKFFDQQLRVALLSRIEGDLHFWRDVDDIQLETVGSRARSRALYSAPTLMIAVVSFKYLERAWCRRELQTFYDLCNDFERGRPRERIMKIPQAQCARGHVTRPAPGPRPEIPIFDLNPATQEERPYYINGRLMQRHEQAYFDAINEIVEVLGTLLTKSCASVGRGSR